MRIQGQGKVKDVGLKALATMPALEELDAKIALIQALIPLGLQAVAETLTAEVTALTGEWYQRSRSLPGAVRWSHQRGSVSLLDQTLPITCQRVRDRLQKREIPLRTYQQLRAATGRGCRALSDDPAQPVLSPV
jgi:hypothetical protein